jgi:hypothetical protein
MENLSKIMTSKPSYNLFNAQMYLFKEHIQKKGGKCVKFHMFLYRIDLYGDVFYLKVNLLDNLLFLLTKNYPGSPYLFHSVKEVKNWFDEIKQVEQ